MTGLNLPLGMPLILQNEIFLPILKSCNPFSVVLPIFLSNKLVRIQKKIFEERVQKKLLQRLVH